MDFMGFIGRKQNTLLAPNPTVGKVFLKKKHLPPPRVKEQNTPQKERQ